MEVKTEKQERFPCPMCAGNLTHYELHHQTHCWHCKNPFPHLTDASEAATGGGEINWKEKHQALSVVHEVFATAIRKALHITCPVPLSDITDTAVSVFASHAENWELKYGKTPSVGALNVAGAAPINKSIPVPLELEEIAEKWAMTLNGNHFHLPFNGPVMRYVSELFLAACTEACQSRDSFIKELQTNHVDDVLQIQRLKEALLFVTKQDWLKGARAVARAALSEENKKA